MFDEMEKKTAQQSTGCKRGNDLQSPTRAMATEGKGERSGKYEKTIQRNQETTIQPTRP